jgi:hypothetical protein
LLLIGVGLLRSDGCSVPDVLPLPPSISADVECWLVVVEEKADRPKGMAAFERSEYRAGLPANNVRYLNLNDDGQDETTRRYVELLGDSIPGFVLLRGDTGQVLESGDVPDPVTTEWFSNLIKRELGR